MINDKLITHQLPLRHMLQYFHEFPCQVHQANIQVFVSASIERRSKQLKQLKQTVQWRDDTTE